jgi:hypothetical protein
MKSQSAIEFILTYGWAFFLVLGAIAVLYSLDVINLNTLLPSHCDFLGQTICKDYKVTPTNMLFVITNDFGTDLFLRNASINDSQGITCSYASPQRVWNRSSDLLLNFTGCSGPALRSGNRLDARLTITFFRNSTCVNGANPACVYANQAIIQTVVE